MTASTRAQSSSDIVSIECFPALLPLRKPLVMSTYRIDDGPVLFVRICTRGGAEGWGEAAASPIMSGETLVGMWAPVRDLIAPQLIGKCARLIVPGRRVNCAWGCLPTSGRSRDRDAAVTRNELASHVMQLDECHSCLRRPSAAFPEFPSSYMPPCTR
ncbi:MAG: hypothetical protein M3N13_07040 [Candidatus Eremiobacteraeota bacterium]|nr:hypothetical protein [Candidatus Eremiobacteraeota bacterium]